MGSSGSFTFKPGHNSNASMSGGKESQAVILFEGGIVKNGSSSLIGSNFNPAGTPLINVDTSSQHSSRMLCDANSSQRTGRLPRSYGDLDEKFTVQVKRDKKMNYTNVGVGEFPLNKIPDGRFRIYYFRPKNRERLLSGNYKTTSTYDKIHKVGRGLEFYIFDK